MKMKLRDPGARISEKRRLTPTAEVLGIPEVAETSGLQWFEVEEKAQVILHICSALEREKEQASKMNKHDEELRRSRMGAVGFLQILCRKHPELVSLSLDDIKLIAVQRARDDNFGTYAGDWLGGKISPRVKAELDFSSIGRQLKQLGFTETQIDFLFTLSCLAPELLMKYRRVVTDALPSFTQDRMAEHSSWVVNVVAKLILLYPEKRGQFLSLLKPTNISGFKAEVARIEKEVSKPQATSSEAKYLAELLVAQRIVTAESTIFLSNGDIEFIPPTKIKKVEPVRNFPDRPMV